MTGAATEEEAFDLYTQARKIFHDGGFNLRKFLTNSAQLQQSNDHAEILQVAWMKCGKVTFGGLHGLGKENKVLGVRWNPSADCPTFNVSEVTKFASTLGA